MDHRNKISNESNLGKLRVRHNENGDTLEEEWRKYRDELTKYRPKILYIRLVQPDEMVELSEDPKSQPESDKSNQKIENQPNQIKVIGLPSSFS